MAMVVSALTASGSITTAFPQRNFTSKSFVSHRSVAFRDSNSLGFIRSLTRTAAAAAAASSQDKEEVFFDGGPHYGDLLANLIFGFSLFWLPLTLAAVFRALFLRYRFTSYRVTILSGLTGGDRKDFKYDVIKDVKFVPRFIGEWGDVVITLKDDTKVELKSLPYFREIAKLCMQKSGLDGAGDLPAEKGKSGKSKKGFS